MHAHQGQNYRGHKTAPPYQKIDPAAARHIQNAPAWSVVCDIEYNNDDKCKEMIKNIKQQQIIPKRESHQKRTGIAPKAKYLKIFARGAFYLSLMPRCAIARRNSASHITNRPACARISIRASSRIKSVAVARFPEKQPP